MAETQNKKPFRKTFIGNLLIMIGICVLIYWAFFGSLSIITRHNDVKVVPDFVGMKADSAIMLLEKEGFDLKVDSVYDKTKGLYEVVDQQPEVGAKVKSGRIIFLTINRANPPMVTLPNLVGKSYRTIELELKKLNLTIGDTTEVFDLAVGTIMSVKINGQDVKAGIKIPEGTSIDFVISKGLGDTKVAIPDLIGKTLEEALKLLEEQGLNYDLRIDGTITDSSQALIYDQYPSSKNDYGEPQKVWMGDEIEIKYKQNPKIEKRTYLKRETEDDEEGTIIDVTPGSSGPSTSPNSNKGSSVTPSNSGHNNNQQSAPTNSEDNGNKKVRPKR